jgi:glutamate racemase
VIRPGARAAVASTITKRVGVIGTNATIRSRAYELEIKRLDPGIQVVSQSCPLFVPLVESGWLNGTISAQIAEKYLEPLRRERIDTLILGCTHYPLLAPVIQKVVGPKTRLVDSATQTAAEVKSLLSWHEWQGNGRSNGHANGRANGHLPKHRFFVTDEPHQFTALGEQFLGRSIRSVERTSLH